MLLSWFRNGEIRRIGRAREIADQRSQIWFLDEFGRRLAADPLRIALALLAPVVEVFGDGEKVDRHPAGDDPAAR